MFTLTPCPPDQLDAVLDLFWQTVHTINAQDYTPDQLDAWAPRDPDRDRWRKKWETSLVWAAWQDGELAGFANLEAPDHLDCLYVSARHQRQGVASALAQKMEELARQAGASRLRVEASLTARGFFARRGYRELRRQQVPLRGQLLTNFVMEKTL